MTTREEDGKNQGSKGLVLTGRLGRRERGHIEIELIDGMTVDLLEEDAISVKEDTDPVTQRSLVIVELKGDKPISATFQPHFYRVIAEAGALPFAFSGETEVPPDQFEIPDAQAMIASGGQGGVHHFTNPSIGETQTRSKNWISGWVNDDNQIDTKEDDIGSFRP